MRMVESASSTGVWWLYFANSEYRPLFSKLIALRFAQMSATVAEVGSR